MVHVDLGGIQYFANRRLGDAASCRGIATLMKLVADLPEREWGDLPWSSQWARAWKHACQGRLSDATAAHDASLATANRMLRAAASYFHTDIRAQVAFGKYQPTLGWYLGPDGQNNHAATTFHPGGSDM
jgi:hypothetical protein